MTWFHWKSWILLFLCHCQILLLFLFLFCLGRGEHKWGPFLNVIKRQNLRGIKLGNFHVRLWLLLFFRLRLPVYWLICYDFMRKINFIEIFYRIEFRWSRDMFCWLMLVNLRIWLKEDFGIIMRVSRSLFKFIKCTVYFKVILIFWSRVSKISFQMGWNKFLSNYNLVKWYENICHV